MFDQSPELKKLAETISEEQFGTTPAQAIAQGLCVNCKKHALPRCYSPEGIREYNLSGMCEICFDTLFADCASDE